MTSQELADLKAEIKAELLKEIQGKPPEELFYTPQDLVPLTGLSIHTIYELIYANEIPHKKIRTPRGKGRCSRIVIPREAFHKWANQVEEPKTPATVKPKLVKVGKR